MPAPGAPAPPPPTRAEQDRLERAIAYTKENPWGDNTGSARVQGTMFWAAGNDPPQPVGRRGLILKGIKGTPTEGISYRIRTDERGDFTFDRIRGGEFKLSDDIAAGFHWRLRLSVPEGQVVTVDLTPTNSTKVRDDFPRDGN